jgi:hypothetical protein
MSRWIHYACTALIALGALGATRQEVVPPPQTTTALDRIWQDGERMHMTLAWLRVVGGSAVISIAPEQKGRLRITTLATSNAFFSKIFKVRDEIESVVESDTLSTVRYHKILQERSKQKEEITVVDLDRNVAVRKGKEVAVTRPIYDPLSIIFLLRKLELAPGRTYSYNILADGKVYPVAVVVGAREVIRTDAGVFRTILVEPKMNKGGIFRDENSRLQIWFSDDERHIPVRIRSEIPAGSITATLRLYEAPAP